MLGNWKRSILGAFFVSMFLLCFRIISPIVELPQNIRLSESSLFFESKSIGNQNYAMTIYSSSVSRHFIELVYRSSFVTTFVLATCVIIMLFLRLLNLSTLFKPSHVLSPLFTFSVEEGQPSLNCRKRSI